MTDLDLSSNDLTGSIPPELGNLATPTLTKLNLGGNDLRGEIPAELGNLTSLTDLDLSSNDLTGSIPPEIGNLTALEYLVLFANELTGEIPPEFGDLATLRWLNLSSNELTGEIPPELGNLAALARLNLSYNELTGEIPPELGNLASLTDLILGSNDLTGSIPPEFGNLTALTRLNLFGNTSIEGPVPLAFLRLPAIDDVDLGSTSLCLPGTVDFLNWVAQLNTVYVGTVGMVEYCNESDRTALESFYTAAGGPGWARSDNWLDSSPALEGWHGVATDSLGRVAGLVLPANNLAGRFVLTDALMGLKVLDVENNPRLEGPLSLSLTRSPLDTLRFAGTGLCSYPQAREWLEAIPNRRGTGDTCEPLSDRDILVALYEATEGPNWVRNRNWVTDKPLEEWEGVRVDSLGRVTRLRLYNNWLTGPIPPELGSLTALRVLQLQVNRLTGSIPPELGNLSALGHLDLRDNDLTGEIPPGLGKLTELGELILSNNRLSGRIPPELGGLVRLGELRLWNNSLTGSVPPEFGNLVALRVLSLSENDLTGSILPELGNLRRLDWLGLSYNRLTGPIPPELGSLPALRGLDLDNNRLSGSVPPEIGDLSALEYLELGNNEGLSGPLPATLAALGRLRRLSTSNTALCAPANPRFRQWANALEVYRVRSCKGAEAAYLVQAVQSPEYPVPIVAGRDALLRVFPTVPSGSRVPVPPVRAILYDGAAEVYRAEIPGKPGPLPRRTATGEGSLAVSANAEIPGYVLRPGLEMVVEIDPGGTLDPSLGVGGRVPAEGRVALDIHALPTMELTLVPFLLKGNPDSSVIAKVKGMAADPTGHELLRLSREALPASDWSVTAHEPVWTDAQSPSSLLYQVSAIRRMEGGRGYWMGAGIYGGGRAYSSGWASISELRGSVIAHELGHNLSLGHAPCGVPSWAGVDPDFPDRQGRIGAWGYNFAAAVLVPPYRPDVMSYCSGGEWISDYHFTNALRYRLRKETVAAPTRALLLWGGESESGGLHLEPAFVVNAAPTLPDSTGGYTLTGRDAAGRVLFSLAFAMPAIADAGEEAGGFAYTLPVLPGWEALASVTLTAPDGRTAALDGSTNQPMSILRDSRTGRVRAFLRGDSASVQADGGGKALAVTLDAVTIKSRGLPAPDVWWGGASGNFPRRRPEERH